MRLEAQLSAQVRDQSGRGAAHRFKHLFGEFRAAQPAFPADELRQHGSGDPVCGQLGLGSDQSFRERLHRAPSRGKVTLEAVAMHIDDAGQNHIAAQVDRPRLRRVNNQPACNRQNALVQPALAQNLPACQIKV